jgi:tetratricopeptide (TPR) repeat protein
MVKIDSQMICRVLLVSVCIMIPPTVTAWAADSPAIRILLDRAKAQAQSGHLDIAASTWKQVLVSEPNNMDALRGLASVEAQLGHQLKSDGYIQRLKKLGASSTEISQLQGMRSGPADADLLKQADSLSKAGQYRQAMEIYRKLYGNNPPTGQIALVYYDTEAATSSDRGHAIEGLRKLAQQFPGDERYSITLGRVLTYDAPTRQEGMAILQRYPSDVAAQSALKQAAQWNQRAQTSPTTGALAATQLAPRTSPVPPTSELASGFRALNSGNLSSAEQYFRASLTRESTHGQANAGLGFVSMRQQNFDQAVQQFERARAEGDRDPDVSQGLETSRFWQTMGRAQSSLDTSNNDTAIAQYRNALAMKPDNVDALTALGGTLLRANRPQDAIPYLQQAVRLDAKSLPAWRALFLSQSLTGRRADAVKTAELTPAEFRTKLEADVEFLGALATDYAAVGQQAQSDRILKRALALVQSSDNNSDTSASKQLQYASLMMAAKRYNSAVRSYRRVLASDSDSSDAWRGVVTAEHLGGRDAEALRAFQQMPPEVSSAAQTDTDFLSMLAGIYQSQSQTDAARSTLQRAIRIHPALSLQLQLASVELAGGNKERAAQLYQQITDEYPDSKQAWIGYVQGLHAIGHDREALRQLQQMPEDISSSLQDDPDYLQATAAVYSALGNNRRAAEAVDRANDIYSEQGIAPPASVQIQEGWLYLQAGANKRLSDIIQQLNSEDDLAQDQKEELSRLWTSWALKRATQFRQQGNSQSAVLILSTALRAFPSDASVNNALADTYVEAGDPKRAVLLYAREDISQADKAICASAIRAALAAGNRKQAEVWLQTSLSRFGRDARILQLAAEFEQQRGDSRRAVAYYRAALQAAGPPTIDELTSSQARSSNTSQLSATQELFSMLSSSGNSSGSALSSGGENFDGRQPLWSTRSSSSRSRESDLDTPSESETSLAPLSPRRSSHAGRNSSDWSSPSTDALSDHGDTLPSIKPTDRAEQFALSTTHQAFGSDDADSDLQFDAAEQPSVRHNSSQPNSSAGISSSRSTTLPIDDDSLFVEPPAPAPRSNAWLPPHPTHNLDTLDSPQSVAMLMAPPASTEPLPPLTGSAIVVARQQSPREDMEQHLDAIQVASSPYLGGRSWVGFHSGQPGYDRLTIFSADIEQSSMIANGARLSVVVHPTLLQSGVTDSNATFQLGTLPAGTVSNAQSSAGVGGELQLRTRSFGAAVGYTPHGFLAENVTGRLLIQPDAGPVTITFDRQPIEDSQLSYAGLRDPGSISSNFSGNIWGGVIANAGSIQVRRGGASSGWYIAGGGQNITGQHVRSNTRIDGYAGAYWSVWERPEYGKLTLGMNLFGMHFANNQHLFTYGNGGYFSPGAYLLSNIPITFEGHYGTRFHYRAAGSIGLQAFQEDVAPYYPLDPGLQIANNNPSLPERTSVGANYNVEGEASYLMTDHWHVGGFFTVDNSSDYLNSRVGFYLRYVTHPQSLDSIMGPTGFDRRTGLRPLLIP